MQSQYTKNIHELKFEMNGHDLNAILEIKKVIDEKFKPTNKDDYTITEWVAESYERISKWFENGYDEHDWDEKIDCIQSNEGLTVIEIVSTDLNIFAKRIK